MHMLTHPWFHALLLVAGFLCLWTSSPQTSMDSLTWVPGPSTSPARAAAPLSWWLTPGSVRHPRRTKNPETLDIAASTAQARQLTFLGSRPVVVATHSPRFRMASGLPEPLAIKLEDATQRMQKQFLTLSSDSNQNIAATAGHELPHEDASFVIENILQGVSLVRQRH